MDSEISFSPQETAAFKAAGNPVQGEKRLSVLQQYGLVGKWMNNVPDRTGPVPSMKGVTINQALSLCEHWGDDDTTVFDESAKSLASITWGIAAVVIAVIVVIAWIARPVGMFILAFIALFFAVSRLVGHFNDKEIRFNDIRENYSD